MPFLKRIVYSAVAIYAVAIPISANGQDTTQGREQEKSSSQRAHLKSIYSPYLPDGYITWLDESGNVVDYPTPARATGLQSGWSQGFVSASDGVKIHYVEAGEVRTSGAIALGPGSGPGSSVGGGGSTAKIRQSVTILFVPGWTMPAWIWEKQIAYFSREYHVVAIDPRSQGESTQTNSGLFPAQMASDIAAVIEQRHLAPVVLVGWSMAVAEVAAFVEQYGTGSLAGIVLVDGGVGGFEGEQEAESDFGMLQGVLENRDAQADAFVRKILFQRPQPEEYLQRVIAESKKVPTSAAVALLVGYFAADYRKTLPKMDKPTLVIAAKSIDPEGLANMSADIPNVEFEVMDGVGHAAFVDDPEKFNSLVGAFVLHHVVEGRPMKEQ
jgi:non-heme chloroperoxidase